MVIDRRGCRSVDIATCSKLYGTLSPATNSRRRTRVAAALHPAGSSTGFIIDELLMPARCTVETMLQFLQKMQRKTKLRAVTDIIQRLLVYT